MQNETNEQRHARWEREEEADQAAIQLGLAYREARHGVCYWDKHASEAFRAGFEAGKKVQLAAAQHGLNLRQLQEIKRAVDDFANFSETDIDYELLLRAAQARYLECTHFAVWNKAALERDLALAKAKQGGVA